MHINLAGISGGKDSSALMLWMLFRSGYPKDSLRFTFCDTRNEHDCTYEHIELLEKISIDNGGPKIEWLFPEMGFYELAMKKKRFPSTKARFCTQYLKVVPTLQWVDERLSEGHTVMAHTGIRANESEDRSKLPQRDLNGILLIEEYRPLLYWTIKDVFQIHKEHDVPLNKLYAAGARRVGCFPCIMSNKAEMRNIALSFPERIDAIRKAENQFLEKFGRYSTFFGPKTTPLRFRSMEVTTKKGKKVMVATIDDIVKWAMTGKRARGRFDEVQDLFQGESTQISCDSGFCE